MLGQQREQKSCWNFMTKTKREQKRKIIKRRLPNTRFKTSWVGIEDKQAVLQQYARDYAEADLKLEKFCNENNWDPITLTVFSMKHPSACTSENILGLE